MKNATKRKQLGVKVDGEQYRVYSSPQESIEDFLLYLEYVNFPTEDLSVQEYVQELKYRNYFEDNVVNYFSGVNSFYNQL